MADLLDRLDIEADIARVMSRLAIRHRKELEGLLGFPPNLNNVPQSFWEKVEREEREQSALLLFALFLKSFDAHAFPEEDQSWNGILSKIKRGVFPEPASLQAASDELLRRRRDAATTYAANVALFTSEQSVRTSQDALRKQVFAWYNTVEDKRIAEVEFYEGIHGIWTPQRAENFAITETTKATTWGGASGVQATVGISNEDLWITEKDGRVCPICKQFHRKPRSEWGSFFPLGSPAHNRCRCWIWYVNWPPNFGKQPPE